MQFSLMPCIILVAALAVAGCEKEQPEVAENIRAIKTHTVTEVASGQSRKFSGQIYATDSSTLSFEVSGNVREMRFNQGEQVERGQILAVVDKQPYELDVQSAEADLKQALALLTQASQEYDRQEQLFKKGWVAKARLDRVEREREAASSQQDFAISKLNLAKRNLRLTNLKAPFDGQIARKHIDAFVEAGIGQPVYDIEASGALEVRFDISETIISRIALGMPVSVTLPTLPGSVLKARITEIGSSAGTANAFPVKAGLEDPPTDIRSGMTTEATLLLKDESTENVYQIPISAVTASPEAGQGFVFVYDTATQTVKRTSIKGKGGNDSFVHVDEGIKAGDIVASAGVSFLIDGQKVKLMQQIAANDLRVPAPEQ